MLFLNIPPQRLDTGATPTFAGALFGDGTAAAPSMSFLSDSDTGFWRPSSGAITFASNGISALYFKRDGNGGFITGGTVANYVHLRDDGAVSVVAAGTNQNITLAPSGTGWVQADVRLKIGTSATSSALLHIGTDTTTSAGGMVFGTDTFLYRSAAYTLRCGGDFSVPTGNVTCVTNFCTSVSATNVYTAHVTLTGVLKLGNAYTAGVGVATGYLTVQDSTGTTYKIPVLV